MKKVPSYKKLSREDWIFLSAFFNSIENISLMDEIESIEVFQKVSEKDLDARKRAIEANLRLVGYVALEYAKMGVPLEDIFQYGFEGLIKAVDTFKLEKGYQFSTLAIKWIRNRILYGLNEYEALVRIPINYRKTVRDLEKIKDEMSVELGREVSAEELAMSTGIDLEEVKFILQLLYRKRISLDAPVNEEEDLFMEDIIPDENSLLVDDYIIHNEEMQMVLKYLEMIDEKRREIFELYTGLKDGIRRSEQTIAKELRCPPSYVTATVKRIESELRNLIKNDDMGTKAL